MMKVAATCIRNFSFAFKSPKSSIIPKMKIMSPAMMMGRNVFMARFDWVLRKRQTATVTARQDINIHKRKREPSSKNSKNTNKRLFL